MIHTLRAFLQFVNPMSSIQKIIIGIIAVVSIVSTFMFFDASDPENTAPKGSLEVVPGSPTNTGKGTKQTESSVNNGKLGTSLLDQLKKKGGATKHPEIQAMLQTFLNTSSSKERSISLRKLAEYIAKTDPSQAWDVFESIAKQATGKAKAESYLFSRTFLTHFTPDNPGAATEWAVLLPEDLSVAALQTTAPAWASTDLNAFLDWLGEVENPKLRSTALKDVSMKMADSNDTLAQEAWIEHAITMPEAESQAASIVAVWSELDTEKAYHWIETIEDPVQQDQALVSMADSIAKTDPKLASEWVEQFPKGAARDKAVAATAQKWISADPASAAEWLGEFNESKYLGTVSTTIYSAWHQKDPDKANEWLETLDMAPSTKEYLTNMHKAVPALPQAGENP